MDATELSATVIGLVLEGKLNPQQVPNNALVGQWGKAIELIKANPDALKDKDKADSLLAQCLLVDDIAIAHTEARRHNGLGEDGVFSWVQSANDATRLYTFGKTLERSAKKALTNDPVDLGKLYQEIGDLLAGKLSGAKPANLIDYKNYVAYTKSGISWLDDIIGGWATDGIINVIAPQGTGKCFAKGTKVLMYNGTVKSVEHVRVGDLVMGNDSTPRKVLHTHSGVDNMFDVIPTKGEKYTVNSQHILSLRPSGSDYNSGRIDNVSIDEYFSRVPDFRVRSMGWRSGVEFDEKPVSIDPYFLGVWLGDGDNDRTAVTSNDQEIVEYITNYAHSLGMYVTHGDKSRYFYHIVTAQGKGNGAWKTNPLKSMLMDYGLMGNKHVPLDYKTNSRSIRLQVLAGILDTDGSLDKCNGYDYISIDEQLADDVVYLSRSLGLAAYKKKCNKTCTNTGKVGTYFRVYISGDISIIPCKLPRKVARVRTGRTKNVLYTGIKVVPVGVGEYYGFETDGNHLFLLADFTVVHNSFFQFFTVCRWLEAHPDKTAVIYTLEMSDRHYLARSLDMYPQFLDLVNSGRLYVSGSVRNVDDLVAEVTTTKHGFVGVDDLSKLAGESSPDKYERVLTRLNEIARFQEIPVQVLAQPTREAKKSKKFIDIYDGGWSSAIENSAAMYLTLNRVSYADPEWSDTRFVPVEKDNPQKTDRFYICFWKFRDNRPAEMQQGLGAIRLEPNKHTGRYNQIWVGEALDNKLWPVTYQRPQSIGAPQQQVSNENKPTLRLNRI